MLELQKRCNDKNTGMVKERNYKNKGINPIFFNLKII